MNILFIGPYRQCDGWGIGGKQYAKALETIKEYNVAIRPIYMSNSIGSVDDQLIEMENRTFKSYDIILQNVLPHLYEGHDIPSIGVFALETDIKNTHWKRYIDMMDAVFTTSEHEKKILNNLPYNNVYNVSQAINTSVFSKDYGRFDGIPDDTFNFYFIGELNDRKNLEALITAFFVEFKLQEPVSLVVKVNKSGVNETQLSEIIKRSLKIIKDKLRIYENPNLYPLIKFIPNFVDETEIYQIHQSCDCFVMPSCGEAFCRPAIDAMGFGNTPVVTNNTGMNDFVNEDTGWLVPSYKAPVNTDSPPLPWIYTGRETWQQIDVLELGHSMRKCFELQQNGKRDIMQSTGKKLIMNNFSHEAIGKRIKQALDDYTSN
jgi:glycosyltransferase involved in cell wall biosynthesis